MTTAERRNIEATLAEFRERIVELIADAHAAGIPERLFSVELRNAAPRESRVTKVLALLKAGDTTCVAVAKRLGVCVRTAHRYVQTLRGRGHRIEALHGKNGGLRYLGFAARRR